MYRIITHLKKLHVVSGLFTPEYQTYAWLLLVLYYC
jgi:hypothetical protein